MSREVVIVSAVRTAVGSFQGALADISAPQLGSTVIQEALKRANLVDSQVDEVIMGNVLQAGLGQNPARQAWLKAGYSQFVPAMTINKVCGRLKGCHAGGTVCQSRRCGYRGGRRYGKYDAGALSAARGSFWACGSVTAQWWIR